MELFYKGQARESMMNNLPETLKREKLTVKHPRNLIATNWLIFILAVASGGIVANLYYAQTLLSLIGDSINLAPYMLLVSLWGVL